MRPHSTARLSSDRRNVDDAPPSALPHPGDHRPRDQESRLKVYRKHLVPLRLCDLFQLPGLCDPGIVHEDIDIAEVRLNLRDHSLYLSSDGHVGLYTHRPSPQHVDLSANGMGGVTSLAIVDSDVSTSTSERHRDSGTDPATTARHEGDSIFQFCHEEIIRLTRVAAVIR